MTDRILDSIDFHVASYNLWREDMKVVMSPPTFSMLLNEMTFSEFWVQQRAVPSPIVHQIGGVNVQLLSGIPDGEWVISTMTPSGYAFTYTLTMS